MSCKVIRKGFVDKNAVEQKMERYEMSHMVVWDKSVLGSGNSKCKGPDTGVCLPHKGAARG